jgi:hypothetical protein
VPEPIRTVFVPTAAAMTVARSVEAVEFEVLAQHADVVGDRLDADRPRLRVVEQDGDRDGADVGADVDEDARDVFGAEVVLVDQGRARHAAEDRARDGEIGGVVAAGQQRGVAARRGEAIGLDHGSAGPPRRATGGACHRLASRELASREARGAALVLDDAALGALRVAATSAISNASSSALRAARVDTTGVSPPCIGSPPTPRRSPS